MDEEDNQAKEEKKPLGMSLIEAYGFVGWLFIGVGLYLCISWRMNYSSWGEYFSFEMFGKTVVHHQKRITSK